MVQELPKTFPLKSVPKLVTGQAAGPVSFKGKPHEIDDFGVPEMAKWLVHNGISGRSQSKMDDD